MSDFGIQNRFLPRHGWAPDPPMVGADRGFDPNSHRGISLEPTHGGAGTREEPGTLSQGAPVFPGGTREEPGTLTQGASVFPGSSRLPIEPKTPGWMV
jgi:hypothetical protein